MRSLLDTHIWLWPLESPTKIAAPVRTALEAADEVLLSVASVWEIAIKVNLGKLVLRRGVHAAREEMLIEIGADALAVLGSRTDPIRDVRTGKIARRSARGFLLGERSTAFDLPSLDRDAVVRADDPDPPCHGSAPPCGRMCVHCCPPGKCSVSIAKLAQLVRLAQPAQLATSPEGGALRTAFFRSGERRDVPALVRVALDFGGPNGATIHGGKGAQARRRIGQRRIYPHALQRNKRSSAASAQQTNWRAAAEALPELVLPKKVRGHVDLAFSRSSPVVEAAG